MDGAAGVKKLNLRQKKWSISHNKKTMRYLQKRNKAKSKRQQYYFTPRTLKTSLGHILVAPANFSLVQNRDETLCFFDSVLRTINRCSKMDKLYFNFSDIEYISTDAIMYIIALIKNVKRMRAFHIMCAGSMPRNKEARELIEKSGFYKFVSALNRSKVSTINDRIQISSGFDSDGALTGEICNFVHQSCGGGPKDTKRLYSMVMELMTNTRQHAYGESGAMVGKWYIFAENIENRVRFVFLDTGLGIPATINKKGTEELKEFIRIFGIGINDSKYISSALRGEFRTETKQVNRGKGLPGIYEDSCNGILTNLIIISGRGECRIMPDRSIQENQLKTSFAGTLFMWDFHGEKGAHDGIDIEHC